MRLDSLVNRNKYHNVHNIIMSWNKYFYENNIIEEDIIDDKTATVVFIVIQSYLNYNLISKEILNYVKLSSDKKIDYKKYYEIRNLIFSKYKIKKELLAIDSERNSRRCIKYLEDWKGYRIYGDMEEALSLFLSPFFTNLTFNENLRLIERKLYDKEKEGRLNHIEGLINNYWAGLFQYLPGSCWEHFSDIEKSLAG